MKKYLPFIIIGAVVVIAGAVGAYFAFKGEPKNANINLEDIILNIGEPLCNQVPNSVVEQALGKSVINNESIVKSGTNACQYYLDSTHFVTLRLNALNYETQKQGQTNLDRTITTNNQISMEHFIAVQENGLINDIVLKINDNLFVAVDRSSGSSATEQELIALATAVATYINNLQNGSNTPDTNNQVSSLDDEQFIRNFFGLIEDKKASDAVGMMTAKNTADDSTKQAWGVQFNYMNSVQIISLTPSQQSTWTDSFRQYKVVLDVVMDPNSADAPIPYYGYENGQNTRFINLVKEDGTWRVDAIATGP